MSHKRRSAETGGALLWCLGGRPPDPCVWSARDVTGVRPMPPFGDGCGGGASQPAPNTGPCTLSSVWTVIKGCRCGLSGSQVLHDVRILSSGECSDSVVVSPAWRGTGGYHSPAPGWVPGSEVTCRDDWLCMLPTSPRVSLPAVCPGYRAISGRCDTHLLVVSHSWESARRCCSAYAGRISPHR